MSLAKKSFKSTIEVDHIKNGIYVLTQQEIQRNKLQEYLLGALSVLVID